MQKIILLLTEEYNRGSFLKVISEQSVNASGKLIGEYNFKRINQQHVLYKLKAQWFFPQKTNLRTRQIKEVKKNRYSKEKLISLLDEWWAMDIFPYSYFSTLKNKKVNHQKI